MTTALYQRLAKTEAFLLEHRALWQPEPFRETPAWSQAHPDLYNALLALSDAESEQLEHNFQDLVHWLGQHLPEVRAIPPLIALPRSEGALPKRWPTGFEWDIPGRKWAQIQAFATAVAPRAPTVIDWCAGKGHLARSIAWQHEHPVLALEQNPALCETAITLATRHHTPVTACVCDVLSAASARHLHPDCHGIALHACGKLHLHLMALACRQGVPALSFSPCCYHLIDTPEYQPLSPTVHTLLPQRLVLPRSMLRLAVQETVTANGHARRLHNRKSAWRLGFKTMIETVMPTASTALPSLPDAYFHADFESFCHHALQLIGIGTQNRIDYAHFERAGRAAHARVQRLERVRHAFRRLLEIWLCLDRACALEAQGYGVRLSEFCNPTLTPRNLLVDAERENSHHAYCSPHSPAPPPST